MTLLGQGTGWGLWLTWYTEIRKEICWGLEERSFLTFKTATRRDEYSLPLDVMCKYEAWNYYSHLATRQDKANTWIVPKGVIKKWSQSPDWIISNHYCNSGLSQLEKPINSLCCLSHLIWVFCYTPPNLTVVASYLHSYLYFPVSHPVSVKK